MDSLKVAVVSSRSRFCDIEGNIRHFTGLARKAAARGARLICFPELALTSYTTDPAVLKVAQSLPGPLTEQLARIAADLDVYLSVGVAEKARSQYHVAQIVVGPEGYLGKYRKYHPTDSEQACGFAPGRSFPTFAIDGFKLGINICFDGRHPDTIEAMRRARVDLIHHPHGNYLGLGADAEEWTRGKMTYCVPRATHARAYILINNSAGDTPSPGGTASFGSGALVIDPLGQVVERTTRKSRTEKMILATLARPKALVPEFELEAVGFRGAKR